MKKPHSPKTALDLFIKEYYHEVKTEHPSANRQTRYDILMAIWTEHMSDYERKPYLREAVQELNEWKIKMAQYEQYRNNLIGKSKWSKKHNTYIIELE